MNKRYMDFVPKAASVKKTAKPKADEPEVSLPSGTRAKVRTNGSDAGGASNKSTGGSGAVASGARAARGRTAPELEMTEIFEERKSVNLGKIENYAGKFVKTEVEKRPLNERSEATARAAKAKKISARMPVLGKNRGKVAVASEAQAKKTEAKKNEAKKAEQARMPIPQRPFVNTEKVVKRPLSRNVYPARKAPEPKEEPKGTVTIIEKPENDSRVGLIVTIIITIILGAAAGTVAFLLMPK